MTHTVQSDGANRQVERGSALVLAMVFVALFATVAVGYLAAANADLARSQMVTNSHRARMAGESGLAWLQSNLPEVDLAGADDRPETLQAIADGLNAEFADTVFDGQMAVVDGGEVVLPPVVLNFPEGPARFQARIAGLSDDEFRARSTGVRGQCSKTVMFDFTAQENRLILGLYGVASRSRIHMTGNPDLVGANTPSEGSVLSSTYSHTTAIDLTGNITLSGDVSIVNPAGNIRITGNPHIGGETRIGVTDPEWPEVDTSGFEPYATNVVGPGTKTSGNRTFENIRVLANTNPTFNGNTTIRGIVYIESPNQVRFTGNLDLVGCVVVEPPAGDVLDLGSHQLRFTGNCETDSVEALPQTPQFDGLRDLGGAFILAPGYLVEFTGNFSTLNGTVLASQMKFTGNASGTIHGSILNYDDTDFVMTGNSRITIDHAGMNDDPHGLIFPRRLAMVAGSYME